MNLEETFHLMNKESIQEFIGESRDEDLHLDFKTVNSSDLTHPDDRKNFAKALSGFANSAGGLIVWGVATDKKSCATEIREIEELSTFKMKLEEHNSSWVSAPPDGVLHKTIPISGPDKGCAVTFVPESDSVPHMYNLEHRYYKRNGSRFLPMEHYEVADMFGRRKRPKLIVDCELTADRHYIHRDRVKAADGRVIPRDSVKAFCKAVIVIRNDGRGTAKFPFLTVSVRSPYRIHPYELDGNGRSRLPRINRDRPGKAQYAGGVDNVIHPGVTLEITKTDDIMSPIPLTIEPEQLIIDYEISAEDINMEKGTLVIPGEAIIDFIVAMPTSPQVSAVISRAT
jgi:hypothetical protein